MSYRLSRLSARQQALLLTGMAVAIHVAILLPLASTGSYILDRVFQPDAAAIVDGRAPYTELGFEYPPGAVPIVALPSLVAGAGSAFRLAFGGWMLFWDLAAVALIGFAFRDRPRTLAAALAIYTAGILTLGRLSLARFDLVPATLAVAALVLNRERRSLGWGLALGAGIAVKAWPAGILPPLIANERRRIPALVAAIAVPLLATAAVWALTGDGPRTALKYQEGRELQVESVAATPLLVADRLGESQRVVYGSGSFNLAGPTADALRDLTPVWLIGGYLMLAFVLLARRADTALIATILTGWLIVAAPVLSPQFLIWLLPLAAIALAQRWEALVLLAAIGLTRLSLEHAAETISLGPGFVWPIVLRNLVLLVWLALLVRLALGTRLKTSTPSLEKVNA